MKCINCKERNVTLDINQKPPSVFLGLMCSKCGKMYQELEPEHCFNCGVEIKMNGSSGYCYACRDIKVKQCREKGICTLCFVNPQADIIDRRGKKTEFCSDCLKAWSQMCDTDDKNKQMSDWIYKKLKETKKDVRR